MKYVKPATAAAAGLAMMATPVLAGSMEEPMMEAEPMMEPEVVVAESGSSGGFVVPLLLLAIIAAVASSSDSAPVDMELSPM